MAPLAESGQQTPIVVVLSPDQRERYLVIDGHKRIAALQQLGRDTIEATVWAMSEAEALLLDRSLRFSPQESGLEQGWLLSEMEQRFGYSLEELARRFEQRELGVAAIGAGRVVANEPIARFTSGDRYAQLLEEHIGRIDFVVLAGVDEGLHHILPTLQGIQDRSDLHEVGASSNDVKYVHKFFRNANILIYSRNPQKWNMFSMASENTWETACLFDCRRRGSSSSCPVRTAAGFLRKPAREGVMRMIRPKATRLRLDPLPYESLRQKILRRDGWRCQSCGTISNLEAHHKQFRSHSGDDSEQNLITMCAAVPRHCTSPLKRN